MLQFWIRYIVDTNIIIIIDRILQDLCHNLSFFITSISPKFICGTVDQSKDNQIVFLADGCIYIFSSTFSFVGIPSLAGQCIKRVTKWLITKCCITKPYYKSLLLNEIFHTEGSLIIWWSFDRNTSVFFSLLLVR